MIASSDSGVTGKHQMSTDCGPDPTGFLIPSSQEPSKIGISIPILQMRLKPAEYRGRDWPHSAKKCCFWDLWLGLPDSNTRATVRRCSRSEGHGYDFLATLLPILLSPNLRKSWSLLYSGLWDIRFYLLFAPLLMPINSFPRPSP